MSGWAAGCFAASTFDRLERLRELGRLDLVGLGQDEVIADRRLVEHLHDVAVDVLQAVAASTRTSARFSTWPGRADSR